jgi:Mn-containing catalase
MRTMMQYLFQNMNFRGDAIPYKDLLRSIAIEEMGHIELVANTINVLLEGASTSSEQPEDLQSATYVYDSGNLVLNVS